MAFPMAFPEMPKPFDPHSQRGGGSWATLRSSSLSPSGSWTPMKPAAWSSTLHDVLFGMIGSPTEWENWCSKPSKPFQTSVSMMMQWRFNDDTWRYMMIHEWQVVPFSESFVGAWWWLVQYMIWKNIGYWWDIRHPRPLASTDHNRSLATGRTTTAFRIWGKVWHGGVPLRPHLGRCTQCAVCDVTGEFQCCRMSGGL